MHKLTFSHSVPSDDVTTRGIGPVPSYGKNFCRETSSLKPCKQISFDTTEQRAIKGAFGKTPLMAVMCLVPARLYFCDLYSPGTLACGFQSREAYGNSLARREATLHTPCLRRCSRAGRSGASRVLSAGGFARAAGDGRGWHPARLRSPGNGSFLLKRSRGEGKAVSETPASPARPWLWEQPSTTAVARQLHEKLIASNPVQQLRPLGKHSLPFRGPGRRHLRMPGLEAIN